MGKTGSGSASRKYLCKYFVKGRKADEILKLFPLILRRGKVKLWREREKG